VFANGWEVALVCNLFQQILLNFSLFYDRQSRCKKFSFLDDGLGQNEKSRPTLEILWLFDDAIVSAWNLSDVVALSTLVTLSVMPPFAAVAPGTIVTLAFAISVMDSLW
jgi:hypothetical protein